MDRVTIFTTDRNAADFAEFVHGDVVFAFELLTSAGPRKLIDGEAWIFIDWVLSLPAVVDTPDCLRTLLAHYGLPNPDHPMTKVLTQALTAPSEPKRRGGRAGRFASP